MEEIILYVREKLPIIIVYLIMFAEIIGQLFLKKLFSKETRFMHTKVKTASDSLGAARKELEHERAEWNKERAELHNTINSQEKRLSKIERALKRYAKTGETSKEEIKPNI